MKMKATGCQVDYCERRLRWPRRNITNVSLSENGTWSGGTRSSEENGSGHAEMSWTLDCCWVSVCSRKDFQVSVFCSHTDSHPSQGWKTSFSRRGSRTSVCSAWAALCTDSGSRPCVWRSSCSRAPQRKDCPPRSSETGFSL